MLAQSLQSCQTLCDPMDYSPQGSSLHFPGELPNSGIKPTSPMSPALQADPLPSKPLGKPHPIPLNPTVNIVTNSQQKTSMVNPPI